MLDNEHPGQRVLEILQSVIEEATTLGYQENAPAKQLWCTALGIGDSAKADFVRSVRDFQDLLDGWQTFCLSSVSSAEVSQNYVNSVFSELSYMVVNLGELKCGTLFETCQRLEPIIGIGIFNVPPDYVWQDDEKEALLEEALEMKGNVIASSIDSVWKRNILEALDRVIDAIENFEVKGNNHLTDAVVKLSALLHITRAVASLAPIARDITSRLMEFLQGFGNGGPPALPPGVTE